MSPKNLEHLAMLLVFLFSPIAMRPCFGQSFTEAQCENLPDYPTCFFYIAHGSNLYSIVPFDTLFPNPYPGYWEAWSDVSGAPAAAHGSSLLGT
jgi:hypothetical protein